MSLLTTARSYWPRRAAGLPPGQGEVRAFPRFSDQPLRVPPLSSEPVLQICVEGRTIAELDLATWSTTDHVERIHDFHCVTTWSYRGVRWGGFVLRDILDASGIGLAELPRFATAIAADKVHAVFCTEDLLDDTVLLALAHDAVALTPRHGAPVRLVCPKQYGYKNVKHLVEIDFRASQPSGTTGKKEHLRARVAREERHSTLPNWLLRVPYRLAIVPTALAADRALRRAP